MEKGRRRKALRRKARREMAEKIERDDLVTVFVTVSDLRGNLVDETGEEGVALRCGAEDVFPRIDQALIGKSQGSELDVVLEPEESFGDFDESLVHLVPVESLGVENLKKGMRFSHVPGVPVGDGRGYIVTDVGGGMAVLDGNHPYAGWTLRFTVKVLRVEKIDPEDVTDADIFIPDFLKAASPEIKKEAETRLEVEEARRKIAKMMDKLPDDAPARPMGTGLFTSLVPEGKDNGQA